MCLKITFSHRFFTCSEGNSLEVGIHPHILGLPQWAAGEDERARVRVRWAVSRWEGCNLKWRKYFLFARCHKLWDVACLHCTVALTWIFWQTAFWLTDRLHGPTFQCLPGVSKRRSSKRSFWVMKGLQAHRLDVVMFYTMALVFKSSGTFTRQKKPKKQL